MPNRRDAVPHGRGPALHAFSLFGQLDALALNGDERHTSMAQHIGRYMNTWSFKLSLLVTIAFATAAYEASRVSAQGSGVVITGVQANHSSVRVYYNPVTGAKDYRIYDVANPNNVKYAGLVHISASPSCPGSACSHHFRVGTDGVTPVYPYEVVSGASGGPQVLDVPATQLDWNGVGDGASHDLVVEAVDRLGPVPHGNLYTGEANTPIANPVPPGSMAGSNKGPTQDGKISTNGQGPYTNNPVVIAQSTRIRVQANMNYRAVPSRASATQTFFDTFENSQASSMSLVARDDRATDAFGNLGMMRYTLNGGTPKAWEIEYRQADNINSMPFISNDHFMDMIFAGATPGGSAPTHTLYASMAMSPATTFDIAGGKIAHLTMEVDGHQSFRRWLAIQIAPASDPLRGWDSSNHQISSSNQAIFLDIRDGVCTLDIYTGPKSATDPRPTGTAGGSQHGARLWGQAGSVGGAPIMCGWDQMFIARNRSKNGLGLDDKSRYDLFVSQNQIAFFQDGQLILQSAIPGGSFPWAGVPMRAYFSHYIYHSNNDVDELTQFQVSGQNFCYPMNSYWFNDPVNGTAANENVCNTAYPPGYGFPHSDERHWDNMGFEVLPASEAPANNFSGLGALVQPPSMQQPQFVGGTPPPPAPSGLRIMSLQLLRELLSRTVSTPSN